MQDNYYYAILIGLYAIVFTLFCAGLAPLRIDAPLWSALGLAVDVFGVAVLSVGLLATKQEAATYGASYWGSQDWRKNFKVPPAQERWKQSVAAMFGIPVVVIGFLMQIAGNFGGNGA